MAREKCVPIAMAVFDLPQESAIEFLICLAWPCRPSPAGIGICCGRNRATRRDNFAGAASPIAGSAPVSNTIIRKPGTMRIGLVHAIGRAFTSNLFDGLNASGGASM